jgi:transposase
MNKLSNRGLEDTEVPLRWNVARKKEVVLRLLGGEPLDAVSREVGVEVVRLERWKEKALRAIDVGLKTRNGDPLAEENHLLKAKLGEIMMENELLRKKPSGTFMPGRWKR